MKLASYLDPRLVITDGSFQSKDGAIGLLVDLLGAGYGFELDRQTLGLAVQAREAQGGTTFKTGIAIPHARLDNLEDLLIAVAVPRTPFESDGFLVRMVVLLVTSRTSSSVYLNTLAAFLKISQDEGLFGRLLAAEDGESFVDILRTADIQVKKELTVADIMSPVPISVFPETSLRELVDIFYEKHIAYAPVVDRDGRFVGEVNIHDVIREGIPEYARQIGNLSFLSSFEPFEELLRRDSEIPVGKVMREPVYRLAAGAAVLEASFALVQHRRRHIPVVDGDTLVGVVSYMDILNKILRG
jgi:CBS domain-containing protein